MLSQLRQPPFSITPTKDQLLECLSARILVVDDNPLNVKLLVKTLQQCGFTHIESITDPTNTISMCQQQPFDVVLLDLNMPVMNGFEVLRSLRQSALPAHPCTVIITAQNDDATKLRCASLGAFGFLPKPLNQIHTYQMIQACYGHRKTLST